MLFLLLLFAAASAQMDDSVRFLLYQNETSFSIFHTDSLSVVRPVDSAQANLTAKLEDLYPGGNDIVAGWTIPSIPQRYEYSSVDTVTKHLKIGQSVSFSVGSTNVTMSPVAVAWVQEYGSSKYLDQAKLTHYEVNGNSYFFPEKLGDQQSWVRFTTDVTIDIIELVGSETIYLV